MSNMTITINVKGTDRLRSNITSYINSLRRHAQLGCNESAEHIRNTANNTITPMDTGEMVASSFTKQINNPLGVGSQVMYPVEYSRYVEFIDEYAHGQEYNEKYADDIAKGKDHMRRPKEQAHFLGDTAKDEKQTVRDIITKRLNQARV